MPSARTHDAITFLLAVPAAGAGYALTGDPISAVVVGGTFLFGGLMFGPDLDTVSKQYSRWGIFRFLWTPYSVFFKHRSRWSHGLIFGTFFRVVYFMGVLTLASFAGVYLAATFTGGDLPRFAEMFSSWSAFSGWLNGLLGENFAAAAFAGMWLGAASHTLTDIFGSYVKTGRIGRVL